MKQFLSLIAIIFLVIPGYCLTCSQLFANSHQVALATNQELVMNAVIQGEQNFLAKLETYQTNANDRGKESSNVHDFQEVREQAFILALTSPNQPEKIILKSELTYLSHLVDDYFDRPDGLAFHILHRNRTNPNNLIKELGPVGELFKSYLHDSLNPEYREALLSSFVRMAYGGLIQRAPNLKAQRQYLEEYQIYSLKNIDSTTRFMLMKSSPKAFWMTTKTVLEQMMATEKNYNRTLAELWNVILAPLIYHHDHKVEVQKGELNFHDGQLPTTKEMLDMVKLATSFLLIYENSELPLRVHQLKTTVAVFKENLPSELLSFYIELIKNLRNLTHIDNH